MRVPNHQRWHAKMEPQSKHAHIAHAFLPRLAPDFACSVGAYQQNFCIGAQQEVYQGSVVGWVDPPLAVSMEESTHTHTKDVRCTEGVKKSRKEIHTWARVGWVGFIPPSEKSALFLDKTLKF